MRKSNQANSAAGNRVLLINCNRNGLVARRSVLAEGGYNVVACGTPEDGLEEFTKGGIDLVVLEYRMPRMDGSELIARIREMKPETPVVLISGMVDVLGLTEQSTGASAVIPKGSTEVQHMLRAVDRLLQRGAAKKPPKRQSSRPQGRASAS